MRKKRLTRNMKKSTKKNKSFKGFNVKIDDKMKYFGDTDFDKKLIRVNKTMNRTKGSQGELLDTIVHEESHVNHPKMKEKNIQKLAGKLTKKMSHKSKEKAYAKFN